MAGVMSTCRPVNSNSIYSPPRASFVCLFVASDVNGRDSGLGGSQVVCLFGGPGEARTAYGAWLGPSHDCTSVPRARAPHLFTIFGHGSTAQLHAISGQALGYLVIGYRPVRILGFDHLFDLELEYPGRDILAGVRFHPFGEESAQLINPLWSINIFAVDHPR